MGRVYLARDSRSSITLAVKEADCAVEYAQNSIDSEIEVMKRISNPNMPEIKDVFTENRKKYFVMDYFEGVTLEKIIAEGRTIRFEAVCRWSVGLADILIFLHTMRPPVIYRDMKPSNVIIRNSGEAALVDFGSAKEKPDENADDGISYGTEDYAAPEQFRNISDERSDIYSLGCTIEAMMSGISSVQMNRIISKCRMQDPDRRYQNASELRTELSVLYMSVCGEMRQKKRFF